MNSWLESLDENLHSLQTAKAFRPRRQLNSAQGSVIVIDGRQVINFSSNDYLGLASHPDVVRAFKAAADEFGVGSAASHLVIGHHTLHQQLETRLAAFTGRDRAVVFSSGYMANLGTLRALTPAGDTIYADKLNHASLIDAGLSSAAQMRRFRHVDMDHLNTLLAGQESGQPFIVSDSVFSMDGNIAPLAELQQLASSNNAVLMIDDAHGFGVLGDSGAGASEYFGLNQDQLPVLMGTLGKAIGVSGAFVAGRGSIIETLIQKSGNYIYTTAPPPATAAATSAALDIVVNEPERRAHLFSLVNQFRSGLRTIGIEPFQPDDETAKTPIQPVCVGDNATALALSEYLLSKNILAVAIRPPTVPQNTSRIRFSLSASHSKEQVDLLLTVLNDGWRKFGSFQ